MAFSKITTKAMSGDTLEAGDIAANAVGASELADNAVDTAAIAATSITEAKLNADVTDGSAIQTGVKPHIQPGTLYPAVAGKLLDGSTSHSGAYGTAQSDSRSYYYTDIKGSKPIKDPRIGAHFGSQRHMFKSIQLLEQETATHGSNVYSVDGREWLRAFGTITSNNNDDSIYHTPEDNSSGWEITGYFNNLNILLRVMDSSRTLLITIDGVTAHSALNPNGSRNTPLDARYVSSGSVINIDITSSSSLSSNTTLGIHTVKFVRVTDPNYWTGIELIAQDTTSTATKSQIQIPSQNVVSYGKKFTVSGTPHYNPFATKGDDSTSTIPSNTTGDSVATGWAGSTSAYWDSSLDTATSLGLGAWESGGNYYRPVNGGRVVKWVDSTGAIKTSVNMMPPEAHAKANSTLSNSAASGSVAATGTHNWATQYQPQFGNRTVGSNLWTAMADNGSYPFETRPSGGLNGAWNNTTGYGLAYVAVTLTAGKFYRLRFDASSVSGVASYIGTAENSSATNWKNKSLITAGTNITSVFKASASTPMIVMHTGSGAAAFTLANMTLYELEEPSLQSEVAKSFHHREFGNGAANGGTGATYADNSMVFNTPDIVSYVMDDGLTSFAATGWSSHSNAIDSYLENTTKAAQLTFIGTGISLERDELTTQAGCDEGIYAQNLPYGTHVIKFVRGSASYEATLDGVAIHTSGLTGFTGYFGGKYLTIHQPKMPPIPDDACIIADYMLMADFVPQTAVGVERVSKGTRKVAVSRDVFFTGEAMTVVQSSETDSGWIFYLNSAGTNASSKLRIPSFGTNYVKRGFHDRSTLFIGDSTQSSNQTASTGSAAHGDTHRLTANQILGVHNFGSNPNNSANGITSAFEIATPIHTSHHYQTFETPYLHELVGGDRNMEQNNLVVTPDGKSWDEVTRDVSYISKVSVVTVNDTASTADNTVNIYDNWRGVVTNHNCFNKDFAIAYDRFICLTNGHYRIAGHLYINSNTSQVLRIFVNTLEVSRDYVTAGDNTKFNEATVYLKRGDYVQIKGRNYHAGSYVNYNHLSITKV